MGLEPSGVAQYGETDSLVAGGRVVAPGAGVAVATTPVGIAAAVYEIFITVAVGQGGVAIDESNMQLQEGATVLFVIAYRALSNVTIGPFRRTNAAGGAYSVNAVGAATATVPYGATITATRIA